MTVSNERLDEMLAGLEGLPVSPWLRWDDGPGHDLCIADGRGYNANVAFWRGGGRVASLGIIANHIERCDPDTMRSILTELRDRRASPSGVAVKGLAVDGEEEHQIENLRFKAFRTNSPEDRQAYFHAVSKWFQHRHYRYATSPHSITPEGGDHFADAGNKVLAPPAPTGEAEPVADNDQGWLIYKDGRGWYRPDAQGYTNDTMEAGRYSHEDALSYAHPNGWDGPRDEITIRHESDIVERIDKAVASLASPVHNGAAVSEEFLGNWRKGVRDCWDEDECPPWGVVEGHIDYLINLIRDRPVSPLKRLAGVTDEMVDHAQIAAAKSSGAVLSPLRDFAMRAALLAALEGGSQT